MYIEHSAKGSHWTKKNHKYLRKEGNRYIYEKDQIGGSSVSAPHLKKGGKFVDLDPWTGKTGKSFNQKVRSSNRMSDLEHQKDINDAKKQSEENIKALQRQQYNALQSSDEQYRNYVNNLKKSEDPKFVKKQFDESKKLMEMTLDETAKELTDNTLKTKLAKKRIKAVKKQLNSKSFDRMTSLLSRVSAKLSKRSNKKLIENAREENKKSKAYINKMYKDSIRKSKNMNRDYINTSNSMHNDWKKSRIKTR